MAFITDDTRAVLARSLNLAQTTASSLKRTSQRIRDDCVAGNISGYVLTQELYPQLVQADDTFEEVKTQPGLAQFAKDQVPDDPTYDPAAEFATMQTEVNNVGAWIQANMPASGGKLLYESFDSPGTDFIVADEFTPAQTAGLVTALDALIATIN